jgi:hypothetical protein
VINTHRVAPSQKAVAAAMRIPAPTARVIDYRAVLAIASISAFSLRGVTGTGEDFIW